MKISTKGRYGLRVMIDLATYSLDKHIPLREISQRQNITIKYLEHPAVKSRICNKLSRQQWWLPIKLCTKRD